MNTLDTSIIKDCLTFEDIKNNFNDCHVDFGKTKLPNRKTKGNWKKGMWNVKNLIINIDKPLNIESVNISETLKIMSKKTDNRLVVA